MQDYLEEVFGSGGVLARNLAAYEPRVGQTELARAVDAALRGGVHLLAEAPTGTGKSIAYAVPATWHAAKAKTRSRVVIVTANIALQEQLVVKDLPFLKRVLPWSFEFALAKGRSNYLCLDRFDHAADAQARLGVDDALAFDRLLAWAQTTRLGDVSELPELPAPRLWSELSVGSEQCKGSRCPRRADCFVELAKQRAAAANVVVANYHLFFVDLVVRGATDENMGVLPEFDAAVLDEGHRAAGIARDFFGAKCSEFAIRRLVNDGMRAIRDAGGDGIPAELERVMTAAEDEAAMFFPRALVYRRSRDYKVRLRAPGELDGSCIVDVLRRFGGSFTALADDPGFDAGDRAAFRQLARRSNEHASTLDDAATIAGEGRVYFIEESTGSKGSSWASVCSKPVDVSEPLRSGLFARVKSVTAMSATMTVGDSFDHIACELGADETSEIVVASPFDLARQALLIVPAHMPDPNDPAFRDEVAASVERVVKLAKGRTLGLFTSYRNLKLAAERLRASELGRRYRVLVQGEGARTKLVDEFRRDVSSVLLGTESFWEGVDVPGEALSCVVIDRLPFATPDDPVLDAVAESDPKGWFSKWSLPRAVIAFRQGFGRLIRTTTDRGVVVLLDRRVYGKPYGRVFLRSLGGVRTSRNLDDLPAFLES